MAVAAAPVLTYNVVVRPSTKHPNRVHYRYYYYHPHTKKQVSRWFKAAVDEPRAASLRQGCAEGDAWIERQFADLAAAVAGVGASATTHGGRRTDLGHWTARYVLRHREERGMADGVDDSQYLRDLRQYARRAEVEGKITDLADPQAADKLRTFLAGLRRQRAGKVSKQVDVERLTKATVSAGTKVHYLKSLQAISQFAVTEGALDRDPFAGVRIVVDREPATYAYSVKDLRKLVSDEMWTLTECGDNEALRGMYLLVALLAYSGLRAETAVNLRREHIHVGSYGRLVFAVPAELMKTGKNLSVAIQPELAAILTPHLAAIGSKADTPLIVERVRKSHDNHRLTAVMDAYVRLAGVRIGGRSVHSFRNAYTSLRSAMGVDSFAVMDEVGHSAINSTRRYAANRVRLAEEIEVEDWTAASLSTTDVQAKQQMFLRRSPTKKAKVVVEVGDFKPRTLPTKLTPPTTVAQP